MASELRAAPVSRQDRVKDFIRQMIGEDNRSGQRFADRLYSGLQLFGATAPADILDAADENARQREAIGVPETGLEKASSILSGFIGPVGAKRLANAALRHADDWGGVNRYKKAFDDMNNDMGLQELWSKYGWAPTDVWGRVPSGSAPMMTHIPDNYAFAFDAPAQGGKHWMRDNLERVITGKDADMMFAADPSLRYLDTEVRINPSVANAGGSMSTRLSRSETRGMSQREIEAKVNTLPHEADKIFVTSPDSRTAMDILRHEIGHANQVQHNTPKYNRRMFDIRPKFGTEAEKILKGRQAALDAESFAPSSTAFRTMGPIADELSEVRERIGRAPMMAGYLDNPLERGAREVAARSYMTPAQNRSIAPGDVDVYDDKLMPGISKFWWMPLRAFEPK